jgi:hypothetical protein
VPRLVLALLLAALAALSACSDGARAGDTAARPMAPPPDPTAAEPARAWVDGLCRALAPVAGSATPPEIEPADLLGSRDRMLAYLDRRAGAFGQANASLGQVGPAPTGAGQSALAPTSRLLDERARSLSEAAERLRAVPAVADGTLSDALREARSRLVLADRGVVLPDLALPPDLQQAAATVPSCRAVAP